MTMENKIREILKNVQDPELFVNIMDLGLVYRIAAGESQVEVDFTLTSPACPVGEIIAEDIVKTIQEHTGIANVKTHIVWDPPWLVDYMSDEAKLELGYPI